jgi:hypothetical protein
MKRVMRGYFDFCGDAFYMRPEAILPEEMDGQRATILPHDGDKVGDFEPWMVEQVRVWAQILDREGYLIDMNEAEQIASGIAGLFEEEADDE